MHNKFLLFSSEKCIFYPSNFSGQGRDVTGNTVFEVRLDRSEVDWSARESKGGKQEENKWQVLFKVIHSKVIMYRTSSKEIWDSVLKWKLVSVDQVRYLSQLPKETVTLL